MAQAGPSLFDRLGGETLLLDAVDVLYRKVLKDPSLDKFFGGVNMFALKRHQTHFLTLAFGGKSAYSGKSLASTHAHMVQKQGLNTSHFDTMMSHLAETLRYLQVEPDLVQEVLSVMGQYRSVFEAPTQTA